MSISNFKIIEFAPDHWGELERFRRFYSKTYDLDRHTQQALSGAENHFHKADTLLPVAREHISRLEEDEAQLQQHG